MAFTLYGYGANPRTRIVRVAAAAANIPLQLSIVNPRGGVNTEGYIAKFPTSGGKIPALEGPDLRLTEVIAISWYITSLSPDGKRLLGDGSNEQAAHVLSWSSWLNQELQPTLGRWVLPLIPGFKRPATYNYEAVEEGKQVSLAMLQRLDQLLSRNHYLVGDHLTLADIFFTAFLSRAFEWVLDADWRAQHRGTWEYYKHKMDLDCFREVLAEARLCETETLNRNPYS